MKVGRIDDVIEPDLSLNTVYKLESWNRIDISYHDDKKNIANRRPMALLNGQSRKFLKM